MNEREDIIAENNQYRIIFRDDYGKVQECNVAALSMDIALRKNSDPSDLLVKIERIDSEIR